MVDERNVLRARYRQARAAISESDRHSFDRLILQNLLNLEDFVRCGLLLSYVSVGAEADTRAAITYALETGRRVAVPRCLAGQNEMAFYLIRSLDELRPGRYGIPEPPENQKYRVERVDHALCLVPGLCFDRFGNRLGYGKGYYDRFLAGFRGVSVGVCYSLQLARFPIPPQPFDVPVNIIVTEREVIRVN